MKIGILKSRVEKLLSESYGKGTFKEEIKNFNRNVLSNKNISKLFFLYDELSTNKGYEQKLAEDFVFESITMFENIVNKTDKRDFDLSVLARIPKKKERLFLFLTRTFW